MRSQTQVVGNFIFDSLLEKYIVIVLFLKLFVRISIYLFIGYSDVFYSMNYLSRLLSHSSRILLFLVNL